MISIIQINSKEWNSYVKKCPHYDVFYLKEYVSAFTQDSKENDEPLLIIYEDACDYAINVVIKRDIGASELFNGKLEQKKYYDLISPYGYGGFLGNVSNYEKLNSEYETYCKDTGYICEFVRFELFSDYYKHFTGKVETRTHNVVRDLTMPIDDIWMDFKQKVRKNVKRAVKSDLKIMIDETGEYLEDFLEVYYGTMERTQAEGEFFFSKQFFETMNQMLGNFIYFHVLHRDKIISTELVIYGVDTCYSYLGGTNSDYFDLRPNDFLKYEIIKWAKSKGLKNFVLGGGYGSDDGIFQYKTCLAPHGVVDFYIGRRIFNTEIYDELCKLQGVESHSRRFDEIVFFPEYRGY